LPLQIEENIQPLPKDFDWGKGWRALRIWRELKDDGEFFYAFLVRRYGDNDYGNKREDELWIGREIVYSKGKKFQTDPKKPKFGERVPDQADEVLEEIWNPDKGRYESVTTQVGQKTYKYLHKAGDKDIAKKYETLIGTIFNTTTRLYFVYNHGARIVLMENKNDFFEHTVADLAKLEQSSDSLFQKEKHGLAKVKPSAEV